MTLRAKIDLASGNFNMRDPVLYRINHMHHHRQGDKWCIYPCTTSPTPWRTRWRGSPTPSAPWSLRITAPLRLGDRQLPRLRQAPADRVRPSGHQLHRHEQAQAAPAGGGGPGIRLGRPPHATSAAARRGYTPRAIRNFSERNGVSKAASTVEYAFLEHCLREDLNETAQRRMAVLRPVRLIITNYPRGAERDLLRGEQPQPPGGRAREVAFSRELYIEAEDFLPAPVPKYKRLYPDGPECRLKAPM